MTSSRLAQGASTDCRPSLHAANRRPSRLSQLTVPELRQRLKESGLSASTAGGVFANSGRPAFRQLR